MPACMTSNREEGGPRLSIADKVKIVDFDLKRKIGTNAKVIFVAANKAAPIGAKLLTAVLPELDQAFIDAYTSYLWRQKNVADCTISKVGCRLYVCPAVVTKK